LEQVSAPEYVDYLMTWVQDILDDESIFPSRVDVPFPRNFQSGQFPFITSIGTALLAKPLACVCGGGGGQW
jgi:hypothetical protein